MKLNKQQVEAIASKIRKNVTDPIHKHNNEIRTSAEYTNFENTNETCVKLKELLKGIDVDYQLNQIIQRLKTDYFKEYILPIPGFGYDNSEIIDDIVLGTIEYDNLEELVNKLSEKYANA